MSNNFNVTATLNDNGTISCKWSSVANVYRYRVDIDLMVKNKNLYRGLLTTTSCVTKDRVIQGGLYRITVLANGKGDTTLESKEVQLKVPDDFYSRRIGVPTNIKASVGTTSISLTYDAVIGATGYDILYNDLMNSTPKTYHTITGLTPNTKYTFAVRAKNSDAAGKYSATQTVTTQKVTPGVPSGITKKSTDTSATISWSPVPYATGYDLKFNGSTYSLTSTSKTIDRKSVV